MTLRAFLVKCSKALISLFIAAVPVPAPRGRVKVSLSVSHATIDLALAVDAGKFAAS
jgi:hypothetical protein